MFRIKQYLQYQNTPNGKPRVLVEGVDYKYKSNLGLFIPPESWVENLVEVASLSDCRPLLTVEIDGVEWAEGDICIYKQELFTNVGGSFNPAKFVEKHGFLVFDGYQMNFDLNSRMYHLSNAKEKLGSFFYDTAKYSELLWNCSEEEGWQKVFKLLEI